MFEKPNALAHTEHIFQPKAFLHKDLQRVVPPQHHDENGQHIATFKLYVLHF
jgi:hypothetical protein